MLVDGYWLVPHLQWPRGDSIVFAPFLEKPPLAFWIEAVSMAVFGANELGARIPNATYSTLTAIVVFLFGRELLDRRAGLLSAGVYITTTFVYAGWNAGRSGATDPAFVLFGTVTVFAVWLALRRPTGRGHYLVSARESRRSRRE